MGKQTLGMDLNKATTEDYLRALGYAAFGAWSVIYLIFPPPPLTSVLEHTTRYVWMAFTIAGALGALFGALLRIDIKMELPSILLIMLGPIFYGITQLYFVFHPALLAPLGPQGRYAISIFAFLPAILLLPRLYTLWAESRRLKRIARAHLDGSFRMTDEELAQPGAGLVFGHGLAEKRGRGDH
jgi:hypothetical protein